VKESGTPHKWFVWKPVTAFFGVIGRTAAESSSGWPEPVRAKDGAPHIKSFMLDDAGYGRMSAFRGLVNIPNIGRLARAKLLVLLDLAPKDELVFLASPRPMRARGPAMQEAYQAMT
jgi:hypothetical protein